MPQFCTCGAELPPDARFCHKCGKPQFEEAAPEPPSIQAAAPPPVLPLNFHNPVAVRVGLMMASLAALFCSLPYVSLLGVIWLFTAGFLSVYLYHRRTGHLLTIRGGARMGWITGVFSFAILTVLFTFTTIAITSTRGGFAAFYREQMRNMPIQDPNVEQAVNMLQNPAVMAVVILLTLCVFFAFTILLCAAGGALGAKIVSKD